MKNNTKLMRITTTPTIWGAHRFTLPRVGAALLLLLAASSAAALNREACEQRFAPRIGERGKDVVWVPTLDVVAQAMLKAANTTPQDYVIDLGAGDGKLAITAAKHFGARALGVEYNPQLVKLARCYVAAEGLSERVEIREGDIFQTDFSKATVLTLYLLSDLNLKLRPTILKMRPGTRVVSNTFKMGEWSPDEFIDAGLGNTRAYLWIVPARVAGVWRFEEASGTHRFRVQFRQHYQEIQGVLLGAAHSTAVRDAYLRGAHLTFTVASGGSSLQVSGVLNDEHMDATAVRDGRTLKYVARRE